MSEAPIFDAKKVVKAEEAASVVATEDGFSSNPQIDTGVNVWVEMSLLSDGKSSWKFRIDGNDISINEEGNGPIVSISVEGNLGLAEHVENSSKYADILSSFGSKMLLKCDVEARKK